MANKVYVITDLGPGDGGKGGVVHRVATKVNARAIVKVGGAQGSHGVHTSEGEHHAFSLWGCGTFDGIPTHISSNFVVTTEGLLNEGHDLQYECQVRNAYELLTVDETALVATSYHGISSRLKELARGKRPRGTIGTGVGEAVRYAQRAPDLVIRVGDLSRPDLKTRLAAVRARITLDLEPILQGDFLPEDRELVEKERTWLFDNEFFDYVVRRAEEASRVIRVVDHEYLGREILSKLGNVVVESSHGVLTDNLFGFHPHTSALRTLPRFTHDMLRSAGFEGRIVQFGVHRAYEIRHGAGPMPTSDPFMPDELLPGSQKENNRWQGNIRVGPLDLVLLRYAIRVCGGPKAFDGLAITWFDQIQKNGVWKVCTRYRDMADRRFFSPEGDLNVYAGVASSASDQLAYQETLADRLFEAVPELTSYDIPSDAGPENLYGLCNDVLSSSVGIPVRLVSFGPTELDKMCK